MYKSCFELMANPLTIIVGLEFTRKKIHLKCSGRALSFLLIQKRFVLQMYLMQRLRCSRGYLLLSQVGLGGPDILPRLVKMSYRGLTCLGIILLDI